MTTSPPLVARPAPPDVTVIVPYLRAEATIARALDSVLGQTHGNIEIIAVSDGSTDNSPDIVSALARQDGRLRGIGHTPNRGPSFARNQALEQARGTWVAVLDADDAFEADRLASLMDVALDREADVVVDNLMGIDPLDGSEAGPLYMSLPASLDAAAVVASRVEGSTYNHGYLKPMVRRDFIERHRLRYVEGLRTGEDLLFLAECALSSSIATLDRPLYRYTLQFSQKRRSLSSTSHSLPLDRELAAELASLAKRFDGSLDQRARTALDGRVVELRRFADVSTFRHMLYGRRVGPALSLLARSAEVRRYVLGLAARKLGRA